MKRLTLLIAATALAASPAMAQMFDVAGVKAGMTYDEVEALAAEKGFEPYFSGGRKTHTTTQMTFDQAAQASAGTYFPKKQYAGIASATYTKTDREFLAIDFTEFPSGARVTQVHYRLKDPTMDPAVFQARVMEKYGEPETQTINPPSQRWTGDADIKIDGIGATEELFVKPGSIRAKARVTARDMQLAIRDAAPTTQGETKF